MISQICDFHVALGRSNTKRSKSKQILLVTRPGLTQVAQQEELQNRRVLPIEQSTCWLYLNQHKSEAQWKSCADPSWQKLINAVHNEV